MSAKGTPHSAYDFGRESSEALNGLNRDATRRRNDQDAE
jgi:hypothetical protein